MVGVNTSMEPRSVEKDVWLYVTSRESHKRGCSISIEIEAVPVTGVPSLSTKL